MSSSTTSIKPHGRCLGAWDSLRAQTVEETGQLEALPHPSTTMHQAAIANWAAMFSA
jgi:hypothetical protein